MSQFILYSGQQCHLCDQAKALITNVSDDITRTMQVVDVKQDAALFHLYGARIPVLVKLATNHDKQELAWPFTEADIRDFIA